MNFGTFLQFAACLHFFLDVINSSNVSSNCIEPDIEKLRSSIPHLYEGSLDPTFLNLPRLQPIVKRKNGFIYPFGPTLTTFYGGYRTCSAAKRKLRRDGGNLCPSYFLLEYDWDRIPRVLIQAECSCKSCFPRCPSPRTAQQTVISLGCEKMYTYTQVLRRAGCIDGVWSYRLYWEKVSVGCSCNVSINRPKN